MTPRVRAVTLCLALTPVLTGCRQADGPLPPASGDVPNRIGDLQRDLQAVAGGDRTAPQDLRDDLVVFLDPSEPKQQVEGLTQRLSTGIAGKKLSDENAQKIAQQLWTTVAARQLSEKQIENLQKDVQATLTSVGVADTESQQISAQAGAVQKALTKRSRRWYEFF